MNKKWRVAVRGLLTSRLPPSDLHYNKHRTAHAKRGMNLSSACPRSEWILAVFWCREQELKAQYLKKLYRTATLWLILLLSVSPWICCMWISHRAISATRIEDRVANPMLRRYSFLSVSYFTFWLLLRLCSFICWGATSPLSSAKLRKIFYTSKLFGINHEKIIENISLKAMYFRIKILSLQRVKVGKVAEFARNMVGKAP